MSVATELDFSDSIILLIFDPWKFCTAWCKSLTNVGFKKTKTKRSSDPSLHFTFCESLFVTYFAAWQHDVAQRGFCKFKNLQCLLEVIEQLLVHDL